MTLKLPFTALIAALVLAPAGVLAQDAKPKKAGICAACHGPTGAKPIMPVYPKLACQNKEYLETALKAYRGGERSGGMATVMTGQAKNLTDKDISELAAFYAAQSCQ